VAFDLPDLALANLVILALIQITVPVLAKLASLATTATSNYWTSHLFVCRTLRSATLRLLRQAEHRQPTQPVATDQRQFGAAKSRQNSIGYRMMFFQGTLR
jgi:hypothetical protein